MLTGIIIGPEVLNLININEWAPQEDVFKFYYYFILKSVFLNLFD